MTKPVVLIHGWSDRSSSFRKLKDFLRDELRRPVASIYLADYVSMDDEVGFDDLRAAMDRAWDGAGLPRAPRSVDVVVHSTGALVARNWMTHHFQPDTNPVHRLLMLAPANFGSPLAHKGKAFLGRVVKGWRSEKTFQTGARILTGLELASDFSWELARRDCLGGKSWYGEGACLATVLVGNTGYGGLGSLANEDGSDGTVRVSTAAMDPVWISADFTKSQPELRVRSSNGQVALGVMEGDNHSTLAFKKGGPRNAAVPELARGALEVDDRGWEAWRERLQRHTRDTMDAALRLRDDGDRYYRHGYQNTVFLVKDHFGQPVEEYFLDFTIEDRDKGFLGNFFQRKAIRGVHNFSGNSAYRSVYVDCTRLAQELDRRDESMFLRLHAEPQIDENRYVGYRPIGKGERGLQIPQQRIADAFAPNRTALVEVTLRREQSGKVFRLKKMG